MLLFGLFADESIHLDSNARTDSYDSIWDSTTRRTADRPNIGTNGVITAIRMPWSTRSSVVGGEMLFRS